MRERRSELVLPGEKKQGEREIELDEGKGSKRE